MRHVLILSLLASLTLVGCSRISQGAGQAADVDIALAVSPDPPGVGATRLSVSVRDTDGAPIDGARLQIRGDMSHAGMQPVLAEVAGGQGGRYETPFEWTMGGDWIVTVTATLPDGRTATRQFHYTVEGDICGIEDRPVEAAETQ
ncbi:MAG: hypothetical protein Kow0063_33400 [Anaerolineae bacterium]